MLGCNMDEENNNKETPLMLACKQQKQEMCNILINSGANINTIDNNGNTIGHYICLHNLANIKISSITEIKNNIGKTPYDLLISQLIGKIIKK